MSDEPTWEGMAKGLLILAVLWWSWSGYAWLTSLVDPEEGIVRVAMIGAMAAFLVAALCVPDAFNDSALIFAVAYAGVRGAHLVLFAISSRDDPNLRHSVATLAVSSAIGVALLTGAAFADGALQGVLWGVAILLDYGGPYFFGVEGWRMMPSHFAERFGLIVIIALGESIVAIGIGVDTAEVDAGIVAAAILGTAVAGALWWLYFDVVALVAERRLAQSAPGRERNAIGRDSYGYLHLPMVAGIVLLALGLKKTLGHVEEPLKLIPAVALLGGTAMYLLAHVAFRLRNVHRFSVQRLLCALALLALIPAALELAALVTLGILAALLVVLIVYETVRFAELRDRLRHQVAQEH
jgi:low temperature requirement protein LtrA